MIKARTIGICLLVLGIAIAASWFIEPIRNAWPSFWAWLLTIPFVIRIGLVIAVIGFLVVFSSLLAERARDQQVEGDLSDDV